MKGKVIFASSCVVILVSGVLIDIGGPGKPEPIVPDESVQTEVEVEEGKVLVKNMNGPEQVVSAERVAEVIPDGQTQEAKYEAPGPKEEEGASDGASSSGYGGEIAGRVADPEGRPIRGCEVVAVPDLQTTEIEFFRRGWRRVDEPYAIADASGEYQIRDLPLGDYVVSFQAHGYVAKAKNRYLGRWLRGPWEKETAVRIDQILEPAGVIFGRVIENLTGEPIEGGKVAASIAPERIPFLRETLSWHALYDSVAVFTDAGGRFRLDLLYPNEIYDVVAEGTGYHALKKESVPVDTGEPLEFALSAGGVIEGMVSSAVPGVGADGATVIASIEGAPANNYPPWYKSVASATDGAFRLDGLPAGQYEIDAWKGDLEVWDRELYLARESKKVTLGFGRRITGVDLVLDSLPRVSGRVIDKVTREGIPGVVLRGTRGDVTTDDTGRFTLAMLPSARLFPGTRIIDFREIPKGYAPVPYINIDVGQEGFEDLIIELTPGGTVHGKVILASGIPVDYPKVHTMLADINMMPRETRNWAQNTEPRAEGYEDGSFEISGIPAEFEWVVTGTFDQWEGDALRDTLDPADYIDPVDGRIKLPKPHWRSVAKPEEYGVVRSEPFTLAPGEVKEGMVLTVRPFSFCRVSGTLRNEDGEPVTDGYAVQVGPQENAKPDDRGFYAVGGLRPGETWVTLWEKHEDCSIPVETRSVTLNTGEEAAGVDFVVPDRREGKPEGYIAGIVLDRQGEPVAQASVSAEWHDEDIGQFPPYTAAGKTKTDEAGRFRIDNLWEGIYDLSAAGVWGRFPVNSWGRLKGVPCPSEDVTIVIVESGEIWGRVVRAGSGAAVRRFEVGYSMNRFAPRGPHFVFYDHAGPNGAFHLEIIPAGPVEIRVRAEGIGSASRTLELGNGEEITDLVIELRG